MKKVQIKGGIIISLAVWFLSHEAVIAQMTSCILGDHVAACSSDGKRSCDSEHFANYDDEKHICGDKKLDSEKGKYVPPKKGIFRGQYSFPVDPIPRRHCLDEGSLKFIQEGLPVVLENCTFHKPAMKWTIEYISENLQDEDHVAYFSKTRKFLYYDDNRIKGVFKDFVPPTEKLLLYFQNFSRLVEDLEKADNGSRAYFQSMLYLQDGVSQSMQNDIESFDYTWLLELVSQLNWGKEVSNLLLVGMPDVVTPAHFDILENLYVQVYGRKRVILFSPDYFRSLYPYPVGHPHDRQSQVDFEEPDLDKFPRFAEIRGMEVALEPDEVLYIPNYWWHYIESESQSKTISINFWFAPKNGTNNTEDSENSPNTTSAESIKETKLEESTNTNSLRESSASSAEEQKQTDEDVAAVETEKEGTEKEEMKADENTEDQEEDEQEKTLTPAQHLELLRETELALFKATFNHKKVKQILEELLFKRFDYV